MTQRLKIISEIVKERHIQDIKWGEQNHTPSVWLMILGEEVGEVNKAALEAHFSGAYLNSDNEKFEADKLAEYRKELVQVAAVAIAMIECFDRNK